MKVPLEDRNDTIRYMMQTVDYLSHYKAKVECMSCASLDLLKIIRHTGHRLSPDAIIRHTGHRLSPDAITRGPHVSRQIRMMLNEDGIAVYFV
jgi:hypothetical protein